MKYQRFEVSAFVRDNDDVVMRAEQLHPDILQEAEERDDGIPTPMMAVMQCRPVALYAPCAFCAIIVAVSPPLSLY